MSFASETKNELARIEPEKKCCQLAEISGFLRVAGSLRLAGGGKFRIVITTENPAIARHYKKLIQEYFGIETRLEIGEGTAVGKSRSSRHYAYSITIDPENLSEQILRETGILLIKEGNNYISDGIYSGIIKTKCCRKAYLRGLFMGTGTMSDPEKSYHLEFVCHSETLANDLKKMINSFVDLSAKVARRGNSYIVYMKKADYIRDTLAIMGASSQVFSMEETRIKKSMISDAKRIANCDTANLDRSVDAAMRQLDAIRKIEETRGLTWLPEKLQEVARLRVENPYISISALGDLCDPPLKKSGINNRLKKIEELAAKL
ncbi:MAG: DNA-binding protein WhiA [Anaerovoracaceae bacterium]|nr:DNA-binding protein WhiA [Anaerovoracaceae bacterium]